MITITKERLLTIKQWRETYGPGSNVVLPAEEAEELARIVLASLEAEPVMTKMVVNITVITSFLMEDAGFPFTPSRQRRMDWLKPWLSMSRLNVKIRQLKREHGKMPLTGCLNKLVSL